MRIDVHDLGWDVDGRTIIDEVCATVRSGTFTGLIGPNGSGKTTVLHTVAALRAPTRGTVRFDGQDIHAMRACIDHARPDGPAGRRARTHPAPRPLAEPQGRGCRADRAGAAPGTGRRLGRSPLADPVWR
jgi:energy-coupling factor transporter ATP-binding protein EcfA2